MNTRHTPVRPARARKIILITLAVILLIIIAIPFLALPIANKLAKGYIADAAAASPNTTASVDKVALSWSGPQQITGLRYKDNITGSWGEVNATISKGLLDFYKNRSDLGEIKITGAAEIAAPAQTDPSKPRTDKHPKQSHPKTTSKPFRLPQGLALDLILEEFDLTLTAPNPSNPAQPLRSEWTDINGAVQVKNATDVYAWIDATGSHPNEKIELDIRSNNLFSPTGELQHHSAETDIAIDFNAAHQTFEALRPLLNAPPEIVAGREGVRIQGKFKDKDGVITTADPAHLPFFSAAISPDFIRTISPTATEQPHIFTFSIQQLALALSANPDAPIDLTNTTFRCSIHTNPITLPLVLEPNTPPADVRLSDLAVIIQTEHLPRGIDLFLQGRTATGDQRSGTLSARTTISRFLGDAGTLDPASAIFYAEASLDGIPTALVAPLFDKYDLDFSAAFGPTINLAASIEPQISDTPGAPTEPQKFIATGNINGVHGKGVFGVLIDPGVSISQMDKPLNVQTFMATAFARPLIEKNGLDISGDGSLLAQVSDFYLPLAPDNTPDFTAMTARYRFIVGEVSLRTTPDLAPINFESVDLELNIEANKPPRFAMESIVHHAASTATASARFDLHGYDPNNPTDFSSIQPIGSLTAPNLPVDLLSLVSTDLAAQARDILGPTITANLTAPPEGDNTANAMASLNLSAQNLEARALVAYENNKPSVSDLTADLTLSPATAQALLSKNGATPPLQLAETTTVNLRLNDLALGPAESPFAPGAFRLNADLSIPTLSLAVPTDALDAPDAARLELIDTALSIRSAPGPALDITINANHKDATRAPFAARATISGFASAAGAPTTENASINATAKGDLPTPFIDALASSPGTYTAILGPTSTIDLTAKNLTNNSGALHAKFHSANGDAEISGTIENGAFVSNTTTTASLASISREASKFLFEKALPFLSAVEKTTDDDPAALSIENLIVPIDGDLKKLSGAGSFDPGTIQFETSDFFSKILNATSNNAIGTIGRKVEPINFTMDKGVIRYAEFTLPAGEFDLVTEGKVNLVSKKLDVLVSVPMYALSKELANSIGQIPGLDRLTAVPIRISGETANPKVEIDTQLFLERIPESILGGLGGGLDGLGEGAEGIGGVIDGLFKSIEKEISGGDDEKTDEPKSEEDKKKNSKKNKKNKNKKDK